MFSASTNQVRIGSGSGFWGDGIDPALELLEQGQLDYLCFDFLAELTMSLLQRQLQRNPQAGFVPDAVQYMKAMMPMARRVNSKLVSNGGGVNVRGAAERMRNDAVRQGLSGLRIGLVEGDNLLDRIDAMASDGVAFTHMETGSDDFGAIRGRVVSANVYTDASGIVDALGQGADVVVTGRVSDNALYVGPAMHHFGWRHDASHVDRVAAAITLGHIVECASACSGGMSSRFSEMPNMGRVGFPFFEMAADGTAEISKVQGSGGHVDVFTVKEHLVYEIADPRSYLMPDGVADFTSLKLEQVGADRVRVSGVRGAPPPDQLKLVLGFEDGWIGECLAFFPWPDPYDRALKAKETMLQRFERMSLVADQIHFDFVGLNLLHGPAAPPIDRDAANRMPEIGLRCAVHARTVEEADKVRRAGANLWIMGPGGTAFGTPIKPRPVVSLWPTLIPRGYVRQTVEVLTA